MSSTNIYLYVKQCPHCGLKYFGKTIRKNPFEYKGSGTFWTRHIKKHEVMPVTIDIWGFDLLDDAIFFAVNFSKENSIVFSKEWANLMEENVVGGGCAPVLKKEDGRKKPKTEKHLAKLREFNSKPRTPEHIEKLRQAGFRRKGEKRKPQSPETIQRRRDTFARKRLMRSFD